MRQVYISTAYLQNGEFCETLAENLLVVGHIKTEWACIVALYNEGTVPYRYLNVESFSELLQEKDIPAQIIFEQVKALTKKIPAVLILLGPHVNTDKAVKLLKKNLIGVNVEHLDIPLKPGKRDNYLAFSPELSEKTLKDGIWEIRVLELPGYKFSFNLRERLADKDHLCG